MTDTCQAVEAAVASNEESVDEAACSHRDSTAALMRSLIGATTTPTAGGLRFAELLALVDDGQVPVVSVDGDAAPTTLRAVSLVDLHAAHVGRKVALMF